MKVLEPGDMCKITSGALTGTVVELIYYDQTMAAWRVEGGGSLMWYKEDELEFWSTSSR